MDKTMRKLRESMVEDGGSKGYFFHFENDDGNDLAVVIWYVHPKTGKQSLVLEIEHGEIEQLAHLLDSYYGAKVFANLFDLEMITFIFEQYAKNENLDIIPFKEATK